MSNLNVMRTLAASLPGVQQLLGLALSQHTNALLVQRSYSTPKDTTSPVNKQEGSEPSITASPSSPSTPVSPDQSGAAPTAVQESSLSETPKPNALEQGSKDDEWAAVVEEKSGQIYYWNLRTGQTTELGQPKPVTISKAAVNTSAPGGSSDDQSSGRDGSGSSSSAGDKKQQVPRVDPRSESPLEDKTGLYAGVGVFAGVFLGYVSQFL